VYTDSSKRAVEAADNVVHAYDLNMQMPETPLTPADPTSTAPGRRPSRTKCNSGFPIGLSTKRERDGDPSADAGPPMKRMFKMTEAEILQTYYHIDSTTMLADGPSITMTEQITSTKATSESTVHVEAALSEEQHSPIVTPAMISPTHRRIVTRDFMRNLVNEALRNGHPANVVRTETELGETIEIRNLGSRGEVQDRTIYLNIEHDVPEVVITEEQHLQFSLQKVIDNAIKFTESGSITITVKLGKQSQQVEIWVVDTGCGIAEESKPSLFKPHFQEDASISRSKDGLGLSLFNAKAHVRKNLGGDVTLERSATEGPSRGSEFLIRLPISSLESSLVDAPIIGTPTPTPTGQHSSRLGPWSDHGATLRTSPEATPARQKSPQPSPRKRIAFNPKLAQELPLNILIAEDNAINRNVAVGSLNKLGYSKDKITVAFDGAEAVEHYVASLSKPQGQRFDAILMDIWMPNMDGYEASRQITELAKAHEQTLKIMAVTADITGNCVDRAKEAGMEGFLAKPYKVLDIENLILEHFGKS
jgi:CheY-like chemotaxis protein